MSTTIMLDSELDKRQNWELTLEAERIFKTFDTTIENLQICLCLPALLTSYLFMLKNRLTPEEFSAVEKLIEYLPGKESTTITLGSATGSSDSSSKKSLEKEQKSLIAPTENHFPTLFDSISFSENDVNFERAVEYLTTKPKLIELCNKIIHKISPEGKLLLSRLRMFRERVMNRLMMSPVNHYKKECLLKECYVRNEYLKEEISTLQEKLFKAQEDHKILVDEKQDMISNYENELVVIKKSFAEKFILRINKNESTMVNKAKEAETLQENLKYVIKDVKDAYVTTLDEHLNYEKQLEVKRHKMEAQLIAWISKFDNDMFERQDELDRVEKDLADQREEFRKLQEKFNRQEEEYVRLMKDKAEEDERIHEQKIHDFTFNHAARVIQSTWRAHWARKLARRRARKKKKKK